jgi:hypothetical protein
MHQGKKATMICPESLYAIKLWDFLYFLGLHAIQVILLRALVGFPIIMYNIPFDRVYFDAEWLQ